MGNALAFQTKFENIKLDQETQNYQGVWMEYGDLVHIVWDFQQLEASSQEQMRDVLDMFLNGQIDANSTDESLEIAFETFEKLA